MEIGTHMYYTEQLTHAETIVKFQNSFDPICKMRFQAIN